eukprot:9269709-Prorocentrum_lima.AAC.1
MSYWVGNSIKVMKTGDACHTTSPVQRISLAPMTCTAGQDHVDVNAHGDSIFSCMKFDTLRGLQPHERI